MVCVCDGPPALLVVVGGIITVVNTSVRCICPCSHTGLLQVSLNNTKVHHCTY